MKDALERARLAYERAGLGCISSLLKEERRYATVTELAAEATVMIESEKGFEVSIVTATGSESAGGLFYDLSEDWLP